MEQTGNTDMDGLDIQKIQMNKYASKNLPLILVSFFTLYLNTIGLKGGTDFNGPNDDVAKYSWCNKSIENLKVPLFNHFDCRLIPDSKVKILRKDLLKFSKKIYIK